MSSEEKKETEEKKKVSTTKKKWIERLSIVCIGYFLSLLVPDLYELTIKKWVFTPEAEVLLRVVSTTTLSPLNKYSQNDRYYEITSFRIVNGKKELDRDAMIKIEARGPIIGITPSTLKDTLEIDKNDDSCGFLKVGGLKPSVLIEGEIHSYAQTANDRNKSTYGFDPKGNFKLLIKGY